MAYTSCAAEIAANIGINCSNPIVAGYTGRAIYIPWSYAPTLTRSSSNPRQIEAITLSTGQKVVVIDNAFAEPFSGSATSGNTDSGRPMFGKSVSFRIPLRGAGAAKDIIEPLVMSPQGGLFILEKKDKVGDGSFEIVGVEAGAKVDPASVSRDEAANGGDWSMTASTTENRAEYTLYDTDYATSLEEFERLYALAF